ncbi:hypothetical protein MBAV_005825 [Candidatus Magnetobacterium bavaricum]|uniref:Uncharacterized protein n=1 Tax=Candidatus Magnetobacterium bavaricum TaxID=29290 RepID=A0A0F3GJB2_9BACT|nr:hypothetical protein MBAV_005825 [Candidatus Magnetobacterium bavaricum]
MSTGFLGCFEEGCLGGMVAFLAVPPKVFHSRIFICSSRCASTSLEIKPVNLICDCFLCNLIAIR